MSSYFLYTTDNDNEQKLNIDGLFDKNQRRDLKQISIFNKILNRIHNRITLTGKSKKNDKYIWFNIPEYIFGEPIYDKGECIAYIVSKLETNGFHIRYIHPNTLFVSWENWVPMYIRNEIKKKGVIIDENGNFIKKVEEDVEDQMNMKSVDTNSKKDPKNYKPIGQYKPTGNLVYNQDMFEKLEKKVSFT
jgi:hypothetical protein